MDYYVYIVECTDKSLYTGYTVDLDKRLRVHNTGKGAKALRGKLPVHLVFKQEFNTKSEALRREYEIKQLTREEKLILIQMSH